MDSEGTMLGAEFIIDTANSDAEIARIDRAMDGLEASVLENARKIENATGTMFNATGITKVVAATGESTKATRSIAAEKAKLERAGEALIKQLDREASAYGKTKAELQAMKVQAAILAADQAGDTDRANRLGVAEQNLYDVKFAGMRKAQAAANELAEAEAQAAIAADRQAIEVRQAALAYQLFEKAARDGARAMREQDAAAAADAATLGRLRAMLDPAAAAQDRLNKELEEARRVMTAAGASAEELARAQQMLVSRGREVASGTGMQKAGMQQLGFQVQDLGVQFAMAAGSGNVMKGVLTGLAMQGPQIVSAMQMMRTSTGGLVGFLAGPWGAAILAATSVVAILGAEFLSSGDKASKLEKALGEVKLSSNAMSNAQSILGGVIDITTGKVTTQSTAMWGLARAQAEVIRFNALVDQSAARKVLTEQRGENAQIAQLKGRSAFLQAWVPRGAPSQGQKFLDYVMEGKIPSTKAIDVFEALRNEGKLTEEQFIKMTGAVANLGVATENLKIYNNLRGAIGGDEAKLQAFLKPEKDKPDRHGEKLARDAAATEAQIRNLYALADAYGVSGAAALMAEARVKAESDAIKQRADIEAEVARQVRLSVAQRIADANGATAATRDQIAAQQAVNDMVAQGLVPAERAADLVRDRIADLPLLAAIEAAQKVNDVKGVIAGTQALEGQRAAREKLNAAEAKAQYQSAMFAGDDRLAELREELRLIGATDDARARALATLKATQEARLLNPEDRATYIAMQVAIAVKTQELADAQAAYNDALGYTAERWDLIARNVQNAAQGMTDAFGSVGQAIGDMASLYAGYHAERAQMDQQHEARLRSAGKIEARIAHENARFALATATSQIGLFGDMTDAAKGFFKEGSDGYKALATAEKVFRAVEFALSVKAMAQDAIETASSIAKSGYRTASKAVEAVVSAISSLPFPLNLAAGAATIAALASIGVGIAGSFGGGGSSLPKANDGTGTVFGDASAKSDSIKRSIDALKNIDTLMLSNSRDMLSSLRSIDSQIGGFTALVLRAGNINASEGVATGFAPDAIGKQLKNITTGYGLLSKIPVIGGLFSAVGSLVSSLFGSKTSVVGSGLFGGPQDLQSILSGGFDASYYSDVQKKKKFFGITTGTSYSTNYSAADPALADQFTLILKSFNDAIKAAAGPLGAATSDIEARLNGFVVNIGKIDLQGLTGEEIQDKLSAVFGAAADDMANAAFPGITRFQAVGEGAFETLVRVASTVEQVTADLTMLGRSATGMSIDIKMAIADQFESVGAMTSATSAYFETYYTKAEQAAARTAQFGQVFASLGSILPSTLAGFRALIEAQDLTTAAGQAAYATLLQLAPAFAELQAAMNGAKSAADILAEREDLNRRLLELQGNTAAIRALDLANLDASNRALQQQIWALQDAQTAAAAAEELRKAWTSVGDSIMDEVERIRGLDGASTGGSFSSILGQFNAATLGARAGDQDMAKSLPGLSQALLQAAALSATSQQELQRIQAQTAASLEATYGAIGGLMNGTVPSTATTLAAAANAATVNGSTAANDNPTAMLVAEVRGLRAEVEKLRAENNAGHAKTGNAGERVARKLDDVTSLSGGDAIATVAAA